MGINKLCPLFHYFWYSPCAWCFSKQNIIFTTRFFISHFLLFHIILYGMKNLLNNNILQIFFLRDPEIQHGCHETGSPLFPRPRWRIILVTWPDLSLNSLCFTHLKDKIWQGHSEDSKPNDVIAASHLFSKPSSFIFAIEWFSREIFNGAASCLLHYSQKFSNVW